MRHFRQGPDIGDIQLGIAEGLRIDQFCLLRKTGGEGIRVVFFRVTNVNTVGREIPKQRACPPEQGAAGHDLITGSHNVHHRHGNRRHAGGEGQCPHPFFQSREPPLKEGQRRIAYAGIDKAGLSPRKNLCHILRRFLGKSRRLADGRGGGAGRLVRRKRLMEKSGRKPMSHGRSPFSTKRV